MKRFGRLMVLALMTVGLMLPGVAGTASAQDASWCEQADAAGVGAVVQGYDVVAASGGAGSQIVLGYGGGTLSGGAGNDVLCAWGGGNTLDGGSGNDTLIVMDGTGNDLYGGSGNDTLIGYVGDVFDGGSGRNGIIQQELEITFSIVWTLSVGTSTFAGVLTGTGLQPGADVFAMSHYLEGSPWYRSISTVNENGEIHFTYGFTSCGALTSIVFSSVDRDGTPVEANETLPC